MLNPTLALARPDRYQGNTGSTVNPGSWLVSFLDAGPVLVALPKRYALKATRLLNACTTREAQMIELSRIRAALW